MPDSGFLLINKPYNKSSFFVIKVLRQITGIKKIGHAGTLDPLATGLLICAVGCTATKQIDRVKNFDKEYVAKIEFGRTSSSYDLDGEILVNSDAEELSRLEIEKALIKFIGKQEQQPPIFSAKKINGTAAYKLARRGEVVELKTSRVTIYQLEILAYKWPILELKVVCSPGTYIRSLAHDLGQFLGPGALLAGLVRTRIGRFTLDQAMSLESLSVNDWHDFLLTDIDKN